jgi:hypothetical protein
MTGVEVARAALAEGAWQQAVDALADTTTHADEALEIRASALYALGDLEGCVASWERLYARHAASGDRVAAARSAAMVALYLLIDTGLMAPVRAWVSRAQRMLTDAPDGPVHAMVAMVWTYERFMSGDLTESRIQADAAIELGDRHDVVPASVIGQVAKARLLVLDGQIEDGLRALSEAGARLMSGDVDPLTTGMMLCEIVCAAQGLAMHDLAREWTEVMERWRHGTAVGGINGRCRVHQAELLRISGPCGEAESAALAACSDLRPWLRREYGWPLVELGTIRLRKGDLAGAEEAFLAAHDLAWSPQPGLALLRLAQGDGSGAVALIADAVAHPADIPWKERPPSGDLRMAPLLDAQAEIAAAVGDVDVCAAAADELTRIAATFPSRGLAAAADLARARAVLLKSDPGEARRLALAAAQQWGDIGAPYECAAARVVAGDASAASGDVDTARVDWEAACRGFAMYGAAGREQDVRTRLTGRLRHAATTAMVARFRRDGALRVIRFAGSEITVPDLLGHRYIEQLLVRPNEEVAAIDLVASERGGATVRQLGLPALDEEARAAYRRRLAEVDDDIEEASAMNDIGRADLARRDREFLIAELARAVGMGGRIRTIGDDAERARTSVFRAIRYAINRATVADPRLGEHLRRGIDTGTWCRYSPDPLAPVTWQN